MPATILRALLLASAAIGTLASQAQAADIRLLSAAAMQSVFKAVGSEFERASGHRLLISYATIGQVSQSIRDGAAPDFVIGSSLVMPALVKDGRIVAASQGTICKTAIGMVVPDGTAKLDIGDIAGFTRALRGARAIVYADPQRGGAAGIHIGRVIEKLGLAEELKPRTKLAAGGDVTEVTLALGPGALGMTQVSEIVEKPGAAFVGPLPAELQNYTVFVGGVPTAAAGSHAVPDLVAFLKGPAARAAIAAKGMQVD